MRVSLGSFLTHMSSENYNCNECPSYCCSYPVIPAKRSDIMRLARLKDITLEEARERYTDQEGKRGRKLKHKTDPVFKATVCTFLDLRTRLCTVYQSRPDICDNHPGDDCEWYDRKNLETLMEGRPVIRIRVAPWNIDSDHVDYTEERRSKLIRAYAQTHGVIPD